MKKMRKVFKKIILILCVFLTLNQHIVLAATEIEFQNAIASYCWNFYQQSASETRYSLTDSYRKNAYKDIKTDGYYKFDCVGFVSFAIHHALGMGSDDFTFFAAPVGHGYASEDGVNGFNNRITYTSESDLRPGDILQTNDHVMLYVGDIDNSGKGSIIHCDGHGRAGGPANNGADTEWGIRCQYFEDACGPGKWYSGIKSYCRIEPDVLAGLDASQFNSNGTTLSVGSASGAATGTGKGGLSTANMSDFYYNGIPDGKYSVTKGFWERLIDALAAIFNFLVGLIPNVIKMVVVGWTAIFENLITFTVKTASGGDNIESVSVTSTDIESGDNITIEKIVFNQISIFDVNFFNFNDVDDPDSTGEAGATQ